MLSLLNLRRLKQPSRSTGLSFMLTITPMVTNWHLPPRIWGCSSALIHHGECDSWCPKVRWWCRASVSEWGTSLGWLWLGVHPKWHPMLYIVHYLWQKPYGTIKGIWCLFGIQAVYDGVLLSPLHREVMAPCPRWPGMPFLPPAFNLITYCIVFVML